MNNTLERIITPRRLAPLIPAVGRIAFAFIVLSMLPVFVLLVLHRTAGIQPVLIWSIVVVLSSILMSRGVMATEKIECRFMRITIQTLMPIFLLGTLLAVSFTVGGSHKIAAMATSIVLGLITFFQIADGMERSHNLNEQKRISSQS